MKPMLNLILGMAAAISAAACSDPVVDEPQAVEQSSSSAIVSRQEGEGADPDLFTVKRGCNLECWFSQIGNRDPDPTYYTPETIRRLKEWGFDHIRLCVGEDKLYDDKFNRKESNWKLITDILDECRRQDMKVIFDLQECRYWNCNHTDISSMFYDSRTLSRLWTKYLCADLSKYPNSFLAYDIINEPAGSAVPHKLLTWNQISADVIKAIREVEPNRTLVICGDEWANPGDPFMQLQLPSDPHIIASVHFYQPNNLCFYREPWSKFAQYDGPIHYPGFILNRGEWIQWLNDWKAANPNGTLLTDFTNWTNDTYNKSAMYKALKACKDHCDEMGVGFMLGECGTTYYLPADVRNAWYTDLVSVCDMLDIPYTNWGTKGNFGVYKWNGQGPEKNVFDADLTAPDKALIEILTGKPYESGIEPVRPD